MNLTDIYRIFQPTTAEYTFSAPMELSPKYNIYYNIKKVSTDVRKLK
jgi:hypothetical protein